MSPYTKTPSTLPSRGSVDLFICNARAFTKTFPFSKTNLSHKKKQKPWNPKSQNSPFLSPPPCDSHRHETEPYRRFWPSHHQTYPQHGALATPVTHTIQVTLMSAGFTILPLATPPSRDGSNGFTQPNGRSVDLSVNDLLGGSRPVVRDGEARVLKSKVDVGQVVMLWTRGVLPHEIAEVMGLGDALLDELMRSEEFTEAVNALLATREITSLDKALESTGAEALLVLRDMMKTGESEAVRAKAAMYIIDQTRGKAPQHVVMTGGKMVEDPKSEIARIQKKLGLLTNEPTTKS